MLKLKHLSAVRELLQPALYFGRQRRGPCLLVRAGGSGRNPPAARLQRLALSVIYRSMNPIQTSGSTSWSAGSGTVTKSNTAVGSPHCASIKARSIRSCGAVERAGASKMRRSTRWCAATVRIVFLHRRLEIEGTFQRSAALPDVERQRGT